MCYLQWYILITSHNAHAKFIERTCSHSLSVYDYSMLCSTSSALKIYASELNLMLVSLNTAYCSALAFPGRTLPLVEETVTVLLPLWHLSAWITHKSSDIAPPPFYSPTSTKHEKNITGFIYFLSSLFTANIEDPSGLKLQYSH